MNGGDKLKDKERVFLCLRKIDKDIERKINKANISIVDYESNINLIYDILDIVDMDVLIISIELDDDEEMLLRLASKAKEKGIKIIVLLEEMESSRSRKLVTFFYFSFR